MRECRPFREARRARGVLDVDRVVELQTRLARCQRRLAGARRPPYQLVPLVLDHDGTLERRAIRAHGRQQGDVVSRAERPREDQQPHA